MNSYYCKGIVLVFMFMLMLFNMTFINFVFINIMINYSILTNVMILILCIIYLDNLFNVNLKL